MILNLLTWFIKRPRAIITSVKERGSTIGTEVFSGITIYLSLSYIFVVNPSILSSSGSIQDPMSANAILIATVIMSFVATLSMGFFANLPLAVAPGLEVSTFFTYVLVNRLGLSWEQALAAVFISGLLNIVLTMLAFREKIVESIPQGLRASLLLSVGVFITLVGLKLGGIVDLDVNGGDTRLIDFWKTQDGFKRPFILAIGVIISFALNLKQFRLPWGMLIAVIVTAAMCDLSGIGASEYSDDTGGINQTFGKLDFSRSLTLSFWTGVLILFVVDFVGGIGKIYALTADTPIQRAHGTVPGLKRALYVDGTATALGALLGTSSLIAFVESRLGIEAGGRTGIAAIVCGCLMLIGGMFSGILRFVPPEAAAGVLFYVGFLLIRINFETLSEEVHRNFNLLMGFFMGMAVVLFFRMDYAMLCGFSAYFVMSYRQTKSLKSSLWLGLIAVVLAFSVASEIVMSPYF